MMNHTILPSHLGVAVHTRDYRERDYGWHIKKGELQLFEKMADTHRLVFQDVYGQAPRMAVIIQQSRLGFLVENMPSQRTDFWNRDIYDALYLETDQSHHSNILETVASLLVCSPEEYKQYEQNFANYAETLYQSAEQTDLPLREIELPPLGNKELGELSAKITQDHLALYSSPTNRVRCAKYLKELTLPEKTRFCFVSTGKISIGDCKRVAEKNDRCIILTLSSESQKEFDLGPNITNKLLVNPLKNSLRKLLKSFLRQPKDRTSKWVKLLKRIINFGVMIKKWLN